MELYKYAYLVGSLIFGFVWLLIYFRRPDLRKEQVLMSLLIAGAGLTEHIFFNEYWRPQFIIQLPYINAGVESILLCFFYGGISSSLYELLFNKRLRKTNKTKFGKRLEDVFLSFVFGALVFVVLWKIFYINIIYATTFGMFSMGVFLNYFRPDLIFPSIVNALSMATLSLLILLIFEMLFPGIFDAWWRIDLLSGIRIYTVPIEEFIWHLGLGYAVGPVYEVLFGYIDCRSPKRK